MPDRPQDQDRGSDAGEEPIDVHEVARRRAEPIDIHEVGRQRSDGPHTPLGDEGRPPSRRDPEAAEADDTEPDG